MQESTPRVHAQKEMVKMQKEDPEIINISSDSTISPDKAGIPRSSTSSREDFSNYQSQNREHQEHLISRRKYIK